MSFFSTPKFSFIVSSFLCLTYAFVNPPLIIIENNTILLCYFAFAVMEGEAVKEACVETGFMLPNPQQTGFFPYVKRLQEKICGSSSHSTSSNLPALILHFGVSWKTLVFFLAEAGISYFDPICFQENPLSVLIKFFHSVYLWSWIADWINCDEKVICLSEIKVKFCQISLFKTTVLCLEKNELEENKNLVKNLFLPLFIRLNWFC